MKLTCLAQGSTGNCWLLETETECLILDAGIPIMAIKRGLNYNLMKVAGAVITHTHLDHSKAVNDLKDMGIKVFTPYTATGKLERQYGSFNIKAFSVEHDGTPCFGFLITVDGIRLIYITDFEYCKYNFRDLQINTFLVECNYQDKYLPADAVEHKILGHCELETCKAFIKANYTDACQTVILTHIGLGTANAKELSSEIKKCVPERIRVFYAVPQTTYELADGKCPF